MIEIVFNNLTFNSLKAAEKLENICCGDFKLEPIDDKIKEAIVQIANLYRQRRNYEYTFVT